MMLNREGATQMKRTTILLGGLALAAALAVACDDSPANKRNRESSAVYSKNFSHGFRVDREIYFLLEYKVWQPRRPIWFILPIERPPRAHYNRIFLYRFDPEEQRLDRLAQVRETIGPRTNVKYTLFTTGEAVSDDGRMHGKTIVFAYSAGWDADQGFLYDLLAWHIKAGKLTGAEDTTTPPAGDTERRLYGRETPEMRRYFERYASPWTDNPGVISITELKQEILSVLPEEKWGLPRKW